MNLNNIDTLKVKYIKEMFIECTALQTIDLSNFQNNEVQTMQSMFSICENLVSINLNSFRTSSVTNIFLPPQYLIYRGKYIQTKNIINIIKYSEKNILIKKDIILSF